jgi:hypothetical protein
LATEGTGLLQLVMSKGDRMRSDDSLSVIREHTDRNVASLPTDLRDINYVGATPVNISPALAELTQSLKNRY